MSQATGDDSGRYRHRRDAGQSVEPRPAFLPAVCLLTRSHLSGIRQPGSNPPRPSATPPRRGTAPIPSLEGKRKRVNSTKCWTRFLFVPRERRGGFPGSADARWVLSTCTTCPGGAYENHRQRRLFSVHLPSTDGWLIKQEEEAIQRTHDALRTRYKNRERKDLQAD